MTNGRSGGGGGGSGMASFMTKKKKYRFQVEVLVDELLEVPFVSAVLFAKLRLLDGGNFQTHTKREEVVDHTVTWKTRFSFPCKIMAPASTGVLEPCVLRISVRKECKGGRSFTKLGFVDLNLAEFAGSGETSRKALLEGYDTRRRQDNSMLKFSIKMNMLAGDVLFKVPSPSLKHKPVTSEECLPDPPTLSDEYSAGSIGGSSSGFGSLPKKRPPLLLPEVGGMADKVTLSDNVPLTVPTDNCTEVVISIKENEEITNEPTGHSRNSSNTSQMSKASGYSSVHSHSRQSSSGDSGHIRNNLHMPKWLLAFNKTSNLSPLSPSSFPTFYISKKNEMIKRRTFSVDSDLNSRDSSGNNDSSEIYYTPDSTIETTFRTPENDEENNIFSNSFTNEIRKSCSCIYNNNNNNNMSTIAEDAVGAGFIKGGGCEVVRSKSDYGIPFRNVRLNNNTNGYLIKCDSCSSLKNYNNLNKRLKLLPVPIFPVRSEPTIGNASPTSSLRSTVTLPYGQLSLNGNCTRGRKIILDGNSGGKLAPVANSPDDSSDFTENNQVRRPSITTNHSSSSLVLSETGSLDRSKAALDRRKKVQNQDAELISGRVEASRVNPDHLIAELLKNTNLEQTDDSAESSGLQLFIAKDGTAALGNHEVKSQMSTGVQLFKQVVMEDKR